MSIIRVLSENVCNKIAAGEVIERPASVIKELVENSLDAGADRIVVQTEQGGVQLISVVDNGCGMDADDALLCLESHATSKIATDLDIDHIVTLGFRGEAIPSIASISRFTLRTRRHEDMAGTEVVVHGGKAISVKPTGCAPGTEIVIRDLFFNTPARKKFLRSRPTEENHIQETLMLASLPWPHVTFELSMDGRPIFSSPGHSDLLPRLRTYFGRELADQMLPLEYQDGDLKISGYIARHGFTRPVRREQRVFVNGRPVEALPVFNGIRDGYGALVEKGRYAPVILFLHLDPKLVDVNVHPAKREVRFRQSTRIAAAVAAAVSATLKNASAPTVSVDAALPLRAILDGAAVEYRHQPENITFGFNDDVPLPELPKKPAVPDEAPEPEIIAGPPSNPEGSPPESEPEKLPSVTSETISGASAAAIPPSAAVPPPPRANPGACFGELRLLGITADTYLVAAVANGLLIIDQHAAHERVLYEQLLREVGSNTVSQPLLLPLTVELGRSEVLLLDHYRNVLAQLGFDLEPVGANSMMINAIPAALPQNNAAGVIRDLVSELREDEAAVRDAGVAIIARAACRAAVKAHDPLTDHEAEVLLHQLAACELPFSCPHGRPTVINISLRELERRFGRK